jgi:hypothetical protein
VWKVLAVLGALFLILRSRQSQTTPTNQAQVLPSLTDIVNQFLNSNSGPPPVTRVTGLQIGAPLAVNNPSVGPIVSGPYIYKPPLSAAGAAGSGTSGSGGASGTGTGGGGFSSPSSPKGPTFL